MRIIDWGVAHKPDSLIALHNLQLIKFMADVPKYFETQQSIRDWFAKNAQFEQVLLVVFTKQVPTSRALPWRKPAMRPSVLGGKM